MTEKFYLIRHVKVMAADGIAKIDADEDISFLYRDQRVHEQMYESISDGGNMSDYAVIAVPLKQTVDPDNGEPTFVVDGDPFPLNENGIGDEPIDRVGMYSVIDDDDVSEALENSMAGPGGAYDIKYIPMVSRK